MIRKIHNAGHRLLLTATHAPAGDLVIEGQDLSRDLADLLGEGIREYEYSITVRAQDLPALLAALDSGPDLLSALKIRLGPPETGGIRAFLDACGIPFTIWSRLGD